MTLEYLILFTAARQEGFLTYQGPTSESVAALNCADRACCSAKNLIKCRTVSLVVYRYLLLFGSVVSDSFASARLLCSRDSPGKIIGLGCHFFLQGIFPTQDRTRVSESSALHAVSLQLSHPGSPFRSLEVII